MGLGDVTSKILLSFKADTKPARREIKKLKGEQKKAAQEALKATEKQNAAMDKNIKRIAKVGVAIGGVVIAYKAMTAAARTYGKRQQLVAASAGADIGRIKTAARGLITEQEALEFAAAAMNTEFKLSQKQMEEVAKFMIVLRNQGNDLESVQKRLTQAIVEGNSRALKEFGVIVDGSTGKLKTQQAILVEITKQNAIYGESLDLLGDEALALGVKIEDGMDKAKQAVSGFISEGIAGWAAYGEMRDAQQAEEAAGANLVNQLLELQILRIDILRAGGIKAWKEQREEAQEYFKAVAAGAAQLAASLSPGLTGALEQGGTLRPLQFAADDLGASRRRGGGGGGSADLEMAELIFGVGGVTQIAPGTAARAATTNRAATGPGNLGQEASQAFLQEERLTKLTSAMTEFGSATFQVAEHAMAMGKGFTDAFEAIGSGQKSVTDALIDFGNQAVAGALRAEAEKQIALGVADAILLNPQAALHFAAAAGLSAAAGKIGGGGGGAGASRGGGGLPGAAAGAFGGGGGGDNQRIFIVEVPFEDSPRRRRKNIHDQLTRSRREQGSGGTIERA